MDLSFTPMTSEYARSIASWRYDGEYACYNLDSSFVASLCDPLNCYYAAVDSAGMLVGFCCFGAEARVEGLKEDPGILDIGIGLRPDLTGRQIGTTFLLRTLDLAVREHPRPSFRVAIAEFNIRAQRVAAAAGFRRAGSVTGQGSVFVLMRRRTTVRTRQ
jgi:ribosomal-protein-alanine N-acetyltransferase